MADKPTIFDLIKRQPQLEPFEDVEIPEGMAADGFGSGRRRLKKYHNPFARNVDPATGKLFPGMRAFDPTIDKPRAGDDERHAEFYQQRIEADRAKKQAEMKRAMDAAAKRERRKARPQGGTGK
jgi:hypothetical protein